MHRYMHLFLRKWWIQGRFEKAMMNRKEGKWDEEYRNHMPWFQVEISKCLTQSLMPSMMPKIHKHSKVELQ
jgi:hypothetical protein